MPKGRPRAVRQGGFIRMYTPKTTQQYEDSIREEARISMRGRKPFDCAVEVKLQVFVPIPSSFTKAKKEACRTGKLFPTATADLDNVCKSVLDAMNGIVFLDDSQVVDAHLTKRYADEPCIICIIKQVE